MPLDSRLSRIDASRVQINNPHGVDVVEKKLEEIKQEAPFAYKGIGPIIQTLTDAKIARPVAELTRLMTIKG
jgi:RNA-splicing ligase RtcB